MQYIADLHIHSPFSRATSKASNLAGLFAWARVKGINVVGTGDFTHPGWFKQLKDNLVEAEPGFFRLKDENLPAALENVSPAAIDVRFVLTAEISSIYKRHGKVRKIHNILYAPDFASVERLNAKLAAIGNIESDGRPILGLDSRDLLEILLEQAPEGFLVPAHIWTPWFSLFGSRSGFDTIEECFGDLAGHVFALETGLSSDPDMNRLISALDRFALISNSDCHSPSKLGRETNLFDTDFNFFALKEALKQPLSGAFAGTIEFFPEEGKYHCDGHRKCHVCLEPVETRKLGAICPVCQRPLTVGVLHRVMELADRSAPFYPPGSPFVRSLIPLPEVLGEILNLGPATKGVLSQYSRIIARFGSEFALLLHTPLEEIKQFSPILGEAVGRIRAGKVSRNPGYDGEFGVITVFEEGELDSLAGQTSLFAGITPRKKRKAKNTPRPLPPVPAEKKPFPPPAAREANPEQAEAINSTAPKILVAAGPGTGKTFTLVARLVRLLKEGHSPADRFAAITFTNRAADEMRQRLDQEVGGQAQEVFVGTFHRFCLEWLRRQEPELTVAGNEARDLILKRCFPEMDRAERLRLTEEILDYFKQLTVHPGAAEQKPSEEVQRYIDESAQQKVLDIDAVIPFLLRRLKQDSDLRTTMAERVRYLFVDEFQDLNRSQYELVQALAGHARIFAIGDPDQAIYGFRGSDLGFFLDFGGSSETHTLHLTRNYRSSAAIIQAATTVIQHNHLENRALLAPQRQRQSLIEYYQAPTAQAEAEFVVRRIEELMGGISHFSINSGRGGDHGCRSEKSFGDIAVLYRLSQQADALSEALARRGIPFQLVGATPFFMTPATRGAYYFTRVAAGLGTLTDYLDLLAQVKGVGASSLGRLETMELSCPDFFNRIKAMKLPDKTMTILRQLKTALAQFQETAAAAGLGAAVAQAMDFLHIDPDLPAPRRLLELAGAFGRDLAAFAHHLEQNATATVYDDRAEAVSLMTLHGAKGLEFPVVFITGLEEELLPCTATGRSCDVEEERRLFYVGLTRAQDTLILTSAANRTVFGKSRQHTVSRFAREVPSHLLSKTEQTGRARKKPAAAQMKLF